MGHGCHVPDTGNIQAGCLQSADGCLAAAADLEALMLTDADRLYNAACFRAVCAAVIPEDPKTRVADAARDRKSVV